MKSFICIFIILFSFNSFAGHYYGKVERMEFGPAYGDIVRIWLPKPPEGKPTCATDVKGYYFAFDSSTKIGEKTFSALLAAQRSGSSVFLVGTGSCTYLNKETEDLSWIQSYQ